MNIFKKSSTISSESFKYALSQFATGVTIVTSQKLDGNLIGITVSSFNTLSLNPPLVLFSINKRSSIHSEIKEVKYYAINVLSQKQIGLSNKFAYCGIDKWKNVNWKLGKYNVPLINGSLVNFECKKYNFYDGGDHTIFIGKVVTYHLNHSHGLPLIFFRSKYFCIKKNRNNKISIKTNRKLF